MQIPYTTHAPESQSIRRVSIGKRVAERPFARKRATAVALRLDRHSAISMIEDLGLSTSGFAFHTLQPSVQRVALRDGGYFGHYEDFVLGDPICPDLELDSALDQIQNSISKPVFAHISESVAYALHERSMRVICMGNEAVIALPFSLDGAAKADLRRARNNSLDSGIVVQEVQPKEFSHIAPEIAVLNGEWLLDRDHFNEEFRFLARPLVDVYCPGERRFVAYHNSRIVGLACYDPSYADGRVNGYFESIIRAFDSRIKGLRDALTLSAIAVFQGEGIETLSLGLSPFESTTADSSLPLEPISRRLLCSAFRFAEPIFPFRGLAFHKSRYRGNREPRYLASMSRLPILDLYRLCKLSRIDPIRAILP